MQGVHYRRGTIRIPQVALRFGWRCAAILSLLVLSIGLASQPATAGVSLQRAWVGALGKGAFSNYLYVGSDRGIVVYERDGTTGQLSFVESVTERRTAAPVDPSYERCDGRSVIQLSEIRALTTTENGWVYAGGFITNRNGALHVFRHEPTGGGLLHKMTLAPLAAVAYLNVAGGTLYSNYTTPGGVTGAVDAYPINPATHLLGTSPSISLLNADLEGAGGPAVLPASGLMIVPSHTANKINVLNSSNLAVLATLTSTSHGLDGPWWIEPYPSDSGDFLYVGMNASVLALRRNGTTFTPIGSPIPLSPGTRNARNLAISADGKHLYVGTDDPGGITTLLRETSGPDEGKLQASAFPDQTALPNLFWIGIDPQGKNLYATVVGPGAPEAAVHFVASFARNQATGELTQRTVIDNSAEPPYPVCTPTLTHTQTPTRTPTRTPTSHDTKVHARPRLDWKNYPASGPNTADKDKKVFVLNVNVSGPARTISFPTPVTTCPDGVVEGVDPGDLLLNPNTKKKVELKLGSVVPGSTTFFDHATKKIPARCHVTFRAENDPPGDRTFWDNTTTVEVDFLTQATPIPAPPEFVLESINNPARIGKNKTAVDVRFKLINHDVLAHSYKITAEFAPPVSDVPPAVPLDPCALILPPPTVVSVAASDSKIGEVTVSRPPGPKSAGRCTLILTAAFEGVPGTDTEPTNNSTHVVIDVEK